MSLDKQSLAILLPDLRAGGAERMRLQMARRWLEQGQQVEFVLRVAEGELIEAVPSGATIHSLDAHRVRNAIRPLVIYLRKQRPDALLAAMWPMTVIAPLAAQLAGYRGRVVVSEHNNMTAAYAKKGRMHRVGMGLSMRLGYHFPSAVVGVSEGVVEDLMRHSGRSRDDFQVIYNPACTGVDMSNAATPPELQGKNPIILAVGTLKRQKRHDLLLEAFAKLPATLNATLCILGEGVLRPMLESKARSLGVEDRVIFAGFRSDTATWYAHADLFVLSSDYEGFGNVIVEALEQGIPVISTDCPSGPREILAGGKYGTLVPVGNSDELAAAMADSLSRQHDREALRLRAQEFSVDRAANAYLDLLLPGWREMGGRA